MSGRAEPVVLDFLVDNQPFAIALHPDVIGAGLTPRETGRLKQMAPGCAGMAMWHALENFDAEVLAALCVLAVERSGQKIDADKLFDGKVDWSLAEDPDADPLPAVDEAAAPSPITRIPSASGTSTSDTTSTSLRGA